MFTRALDKASWTGLSDFEIVDLAVEAQIRSGCSITGSMDDTWAAMSPGWKVVDPSVPSIESILFEGELETGLTVMIGPPGTGEKSFPIRRHSPRNSQIFDRAFASLINGSILDALSSNGMAVATSTDDFEALRISNLMIASGKLDNWNKWFWTSNHDSMLWADRNFLGPKFDSFVNRY